MCQINTEAVPTAFELLCKEYDTTPECMRHPSRKAELVRKRQAIMYVMHKDLGLSLPVIGWQLSRHHTTILYGVRAHDARNP